MEEARKGLEAQRRKVAPQVVHDRVAFSHGVIDGRTAQELEPDGKAAEEIEALFSWACGQVGLPAGPHAHKSTGEK